VESWHCTWKASTEQLQVAGYLAWDINNSSVCTMIYTWYNHDHSVQKNTQQWLVWDDNIIVYSPNTYHIWLDQNTPSKSATSLLLLLFIFLPKIQGPCIKWGFYFSFSFYFSWNGERLKSELNNMAGLIFHSTSTSGNDLNYEMRRILNLGIIFKYFWK
jgi:predicted PurR-regulated permease PerM